MYTFADHGPSGDDGLSGDDEPSEVAGPSGSKTRIGAGGGPTRKPYAGPDRKGKIQRTRDQDRLLMKTDEDLLCDAYLRRLRLKGWKAAADAIELILDDPELNADTALRAMIDKSNREGRKMVADEALSMLLDRNLTVDSYRKISEKVNDSAGFTLLPPYSHLQVAKTRAEPKKIIGDKNNVQVPLGEVCKHTIDRICGQEDIEDVMDNLAHKNGGKLHCDFSFKFGKYWTWSYYSSDFLRWPQKN